MADEATIAAERIDRLGDLAKRAAADGQPDRAREYVARAKRIAERQRLSLPKSITRFVCDDCGGWLRPGRTARVRLQDGHVVVTCDCGAQSRYPYD
jgi:ribonuclease P protein subunit RPR2